MKKRENGQGMGLVRFAYVASTSGIAVSKAAIRHKRMMKHPERYSDERMYAAAIELMDHMRKRGRTTNKVYGLENLPKEGGYMVCPNHQGKYDAIAIFLSHPGRIAVLMEKEQANKIVSKQVVDLVKGERLDFANPKQQIAVLDKIAADIANGKKFLIFPEGGYVDNKNTLRKFNSGCFRVALKSHMPIVPTVLFDSYRALNGNTFEKVEVQIHYLKPITFEEYDGMRKNEIADLVKSRIQEKMDEILGGKTNA